MAITSLLSPCVLWVTSLGIDTLSVLDIPPGVDVERVSMSLSISWRLTWPRCCLSPVTKHLASDSTVRLYADRIWCRDGSLISFAFHAFTRLNRVVGWLIGWESVCT